MYSVKGIACFAKISNSFEEFSLTNESGSWPSGKNKNFNSLLGKKFLNKKTFPYGNKINFNSIRKGETIGEHEVRFSSGKEIIKLKGDIKKFTTKSTIKLLKKKYE